MNRRATLLLLSLVCVPFSSFLGEEPAQSPAEENVVTSFEQASQNLFEGWKTTQYRESLKALGAGVTGPRDRHPDCYNAWFFEFLTCEEAAPPTMDGIDVTKTDSLMTPFLGIIKVRVHEKCTIRRLVGALTMTEKSYKKIEKSCIGRMYDDCRMAGGRPPRG